MTLSSTKENKVARVFLSIGSNMGDTLGNLIEAIGLTLKIDGVSPAGVGSFYETEPVGKKDQEWFANTAIAIFADIKPQELLGKLQEIEKVMGRVPSEKWGPRIIDIDIVFYDNKIVETELLKIPHPDAALRRFVLAPCVDIDPEFLHPVLKLSLSDLLSGLPEAGQQTRRAGP